MHHVQRIWRGALQFPTEILQAVAFSPSGLTIPAANWGPVIQVRTADLIQKPSSVWDIVFVGFDLVHDAKLSLFAKNNHDSAYLVQLTDNVTLTVYSHFNGQYHFLVGVYKDSEPKPARALSDSGRIKSSGKLYISQTSVEFVLPCVFTSFITSKEQQSSFPNSDCLSFALEKASLTKLSSVPKEARQRPALRIEPTDADGVQTSYPRFEQLSAKIRELGLAWLIHDEVGTGAWVVYGMRQRGMKDGLVCVYCPDFHSLKPVKDDEESKSNEKIKHSHRKQAIGKRRTPKRSRDTAENTRSPSPYKKKRHSRYIDSPRKELHPLPNDPAWCASAC